MLNIYSVNVQIQDVPVDLRHISLFSADIAPCPPPKYATAHVCKPYPRSCLLQMMTLHYNVKHLYSTPTRARGRPKLNF